MMSTMTSGFICVLKDLPCGGSEETNSRSRAKALWQLARGDGAKLASACHFKGDPLAFLPHHFHLVYRSNY